MTKKRVAISAGCDNVRSGIVELLQMARSAAARNVNSIMTAVYWEIGRRIVESEQNRVFASARWHNSGQRCICPASA